MIKIKPGFDVQTVCDEHLLLGMGEQNIDFSKVIALNETSNFIWNMMKEGKDSIDALVTAMTDEYDIDAATAKKDIETLVKQLTDLGVIENS